MTIVLGVSASLRNARHGRGSEDLCTEIGKLSDRQQLDQYLASQVRFRLEDFLASGRRENKSFDQIYANLRRLSGERGLSNSEAALAAGLWGAHAAGADIRHLSLATHFPMNGRRDLDTLRRQVLETDVILLSGPVYFGDRGSLAQEFFEFLREDAECAAHVRDRLYAGITVGAKRNGGQETTLIYQLVDATNINMLAAGNDSGTTAQYGGTAMAGDVGTAASDQYGLDTAIGTGRRLAHLSRLLEAAQSGAVTDTTRIAIWLLQDTEDHRGRAMFERLCREIEAQVPGVAFDLLDCSEEEIYRCIACDLCPVDTGPREEYRCIIGSKDDFFVRHHERLLTADAILPAAYSPVERGHVHSVYQRFIERTRYLRRDDYVFSDLLAAPLVISEIGANQNLHIRMLTSLIRHHTVLHHPLLGFELNGEIVNWPAMVEQGLSFARNAMRVTAGRLRLPASSVATVNYNPVGYVISAEKKLADEASGRLEQASAQRQQAREQQRSRVRG